MTTATPKIHDGARPGVGMVAETPQKAHQAGVTPGMAEGGKPPTKEGTKITKMGMRKTFTLGTKGPTMNTPRPTNKNKTVIMV
jgi:hypothetical protein